MPKVIVNKCPHTGYLFEDQAEYNRHLRRLSRERCHAREWAALLENLVSTISKIQQVKNMQEWCEYLVKHQKEFIIYGALNDNFTGHKVRAAMEKGAKMKVPKIQGIAIWRPKYSKSVSNSHNCPRNGETNWGGNKEHGIRGYPGWTANIRLEYENEREEDFNIEVTFSGKKRKEYIKAPSISDITGGFGSSSSLTGVNTGSGGGGGGGRYGAQIFVQDFPKIEKYVEEQIFEIEKNATFQRMKQGWAKEDLSVLDWIGEGKVGKCDTSF